MSELSAALGLAQMKFVDSNLERRRKLDLTYRTALTGIPGLRLYLLPRGFLPTTDTFLYLWKIVSPAAGTNSTVSCVKLASIPDDTSILWYLISPCLLPFHRQRVQSPKCTEIASQVICLPIYSDMTASDQSKVIGIATQLPESSDVQDVIVKQVKNQKWSQSVLPLSVFLLRHLIRKISSRSAWRVS